MLRICDGGGGGFGCPFREGGDSDPIFADILSYSPFVSESQFGSLRTI